MDDLSCGAFVLSGQTTCTCTVTGGVLRWRVADENDDVINNILFFPSNLGITIIGPLGFQAVLTNSTAVTLTATLSFTTLPEYEGYMIRCDTDGNPVTVTISIAGIY